MDKLEQLKELLQSYHKVAIAYSGGVDSNFLFEVAKATLGADNVLAVFCQGAMIAESEKAEASMMLKGARHRVVDIDVLAIEQFKHNDKLRCYHCKFAIMSKVIAVAKEEGFAIVLDGRNHDDGKSYRPGIQACEKLGILSPLAGVAMTKAEIRAYSKQLKIATYDKPANACLASRFDYGTELDLSKLERVAQGEEIIREMGIASLRLRVAGDLARIEVEPQDFEKIIGSSQLVAKLKKLGFTYVTLDLAGLKSGGYDRES